MKISKFIENNKGIVVVLLIILALMFLGNTGSSPMPIMGKNMAYAESAVLDSGMARGIAFDEGYSSGEKIRKTANLNVEVEQSDYESTKSKVDALIVDGLYTNKNEYKSNYGNREYKNYRITIKVPVAQYSNIVSQLKTVGNVKSFSESADDLTTQYKDIEAYLTSYKKEKLKVEELLDKAEDIQDIILIENKLSELQRNIDNYQKQLINMDRQVNYGTIYFSMSEKVSASQIALQWTGLMDHLRNIVRGFDDVLVFITSNIGWLIFILLGYGGYKFFKKA